MFPSVAKHLLVAQISTANSFVEEQESSEKIKDRLKTKWKRNESTRGIAIAKRGERRLSLILSRQFERANAG